MHEVWITHVGHAMPGPALKQADIGSWIESRLAKDSNIDRLRRFIVHSGIDVRHSVLDLFGAEGETFYPKRGAASDATARSRAFSRHALPLSLAAVERAGFTDFSRITHVVVATCTGAIAPGLDIQLVQALKLSSRVRRTMIGFMGCYAAIPALRVARDACRADPKAVALVVCCELGSLHFQPGPADDALMAACLFADGAAAAIVESGDQPNGAGLRFLNDASVLVPDTDEHMAWEAGPRGFILRIAPTVGKALALELDELKRELLPDGRETRWAIHPGGPRILEAAADKLSLTRNALSASYATLAQGGNRSSATILAIVDKELDAPWSGPIATMAFGPGLTAEGLLLERCS